MMPPKKRNPRKKHPPHYQRILDWTNSILFENHILRCTYCGFLIVRDKWFRIRKDNGIVVAFCSRKHERIYDAKYLHRGHEAYVRHKL